MKLPPRLKIIHKWLLIAGLTVLILGGIGWLLFFSPWRGWELHLGRIQTLWEEKKTPAHEKKGTFHKMDPFVVNLADPGQMRYLKVRLEMESNAAKTSEELEQKLPQIRDAVLMVLSSKTRQEISDSAGKKNLREELRGRINALLVEGQIEKVFFTEFVIQ